MRYPAQAEHFINRRSCEDSLRKSFKDKLTSNTRSIQSDPGVYGDSLRITSELFDDRVCQKIKEAVDASAFAAVVMRRRRPTNLVKKSYTAPQFNSFSRRNQLVDTGCERLNSVLLDYYNPVHEVNRRRHQPTNNCHSNRRTRIIDSQVLDHRNPSKSLTRIKSTSLSSSATSVFSEDGVPDLDSPGCSSSSSCRSSASFLLDDDVINGELYNNNNEKASSVFDGDCCDVSRQGIVKIDGNVLTVNLREFEESRRSSLATSDSCDLPSPNQLSVVPEVCEIARGCNKSKETQTDEEDEDEQCAISELWHLDGANRWSRLDSKSSLQDGSIEGVHQRIPSSGAVSSLPHLHEEDEREAEVFRTGDNKRHVTDVKNEDARAALEFARKIHQSSSSGQLDVDGKKSVIKSKSFLKRVGLEKFGSFRRKEHVLLRTHSSEDTIDIKRSNKNRHLGAKSFRKNRKLTIGQPMLQSGHEKVDRMKCIPIDGSKDTNSIQSRLRKNSCQSLISSSSSSGSGSTSASSTPAFRMRMDEDITTRSDPGDLGPISPGILERNRNILEYSNRVRVPPQQAAKPEQNIFVIPKTHVPGKFPTAIRQANEEDDLFQASSGLSSRNPSSSDSVHPIPDDARKFARPGSVYDNIPSSVLGGASAQDILDILDPSTSGVNDSGVYTVGSLESLDNPAPDTAFWSVDEIVEQTESLKNFVSTWEAEEGEKSTSTSIDTLDRLFPTSQEMLSSFSTENIAQGDDESENINLSNCHHARPLLKDRWVNNRHLEMGTNSLQLHSLSVGQLMILRRLSLLKLTALMESYASNHNNKGTSNWSVPRFIRRTKVPDYKDKGVFGVPLLRNVQKFGRPLPQCIHQALLYLRRTALDQVGLFRKPGVKSRIRRLRTQCENNPSLSTFDDCTPFDVADMVKQFFRDLPDPLMTMKMSETFVGIFLYVPTELRLQTLQAATMLLPDEVRETLKTLLCFLSDVAFRSSENHMNEANLATCFAPSLFYQQLNTARTMTSASSPKSRKQPGSKVGIALGRPDMKEMNENMAANQCLAFMIQEVHNLFKISEDAMTQCRMSVMQQTEDVLAAEIGYSCDPGKEEDFYKDFHHYVDRTVAQTVREEQRISQNKGGWQTVPSAQGSELMFKKMNDGNHLRMWRCQVEVSDSTPAQIMDRILQERHLWDEHLAQWKVLQRPDERTQIFQAVIDEMSPHPTRDYCVLRSWRTDINDKGAIAIIETSTAQQTLLGDVRGVVLTSRYLIEPIDNSQKCHLTHVSRVDTKGRNPEWYNKAFGHIKVQQLLKIKESLKRSRHSLEG